MCNPGALGLPLAENPPHPLLYKSAPQAVARAGWAEGHRLGQIQRGLPPCLPRLGRSLKTGPALQHDEPGHTGRAGEPSHQVRQGQELEPPPPWAGRGSPFTWGLGWMTLEGTFHVRGRITLEGLKASFPQAGARGPGWLLVQKTPCGLGGPSGPVGAAWPSPCSTGAFPGRQAGLSLSLSHSLPPPPHRPWGVAAWPSRC